MGHAVTIIFLICLEYLIIKTAYKYHLPDIYNKWRWSIEKGGLLDKVLPEYFCLQCFLVQSSLITSAITVLLLQLPLFNIITFGVITSATVLWMELNESN